MGWGRIVGEAVYAGTAGVLIATVATAFTVVAVGLPVVVRFDGVLFAAAVSICFGGTAAAIALHDRLEREPGPEWVRAP